MSIDTVKAFWKPLGWTPLDVIVAYKKRNVQYMKTTISYAGRLDPMAEGVLLLLIGEANKKRKHYEQFSKVYETEMILGVTTDSHDALGVITSKNFLPKSKQKIQKTLHQFIGKQLQRYPIFSSRTVQGKPLYWWARRNRIGEIHIPEKNIEITSLELYNIEQIAMNELSVLVQEKILRVNGDFRQEEILDTWKRFVHQNNERSMSKVSLRITCSSGTYIRQLMSDIGDALGSGAIALSITRIQVGEYTKKDCARIDNV